MGTVDFIYDSLSLVRSSRQRFFLAPGFFRLARYTQCIFRAKRFSLRAEKNLTHWNR